MHRFTVVSNEGLTPSTTLITLQLDEAQRPFVFVPGQYAAISFHKGLRLSAARCFSIVSSPTEPDKLQFSMRHGGRFTGALSRVASGAAIDVRGPFGGFVFDQVRDTRAIFMAGGIGITPFMSMLRYLTQIGATNEITLLYSCRNQDDIPFLDELRRLRGANPHLKIIYVIGEGEITKLAGEFAVVGRITPELLDKVTASAYSSVGFYICGPPPFMKGMVATLKRKNVAADHIVTEAFGQSTSRQTGKIRSWPFNVYIVGAVSVMVGGLVVMALDIMKTLPSLSALGLASADAAPQATNSRQNDLDKLVNGLNPSPSTGTASDAVVAARLAALPKVAATTTSTSSTTTPTRTTTVAAQAATPVPVHVPVCKTTPSGVTTCI